MVFKQLLINVLKIDHLFARYDFFEICTILYLNYIDKNTSP